MYLTDAYPACRLLVTPAITVLLSFGAMLTLPFFLLAANGLLFELFTDSGEESAKRLHVLLFWAVDVAEQSPDTLVHDLVRQHAELVQFANKSD